MCLGCFVVSASSTAHLYRELNLVQSRRKSGQNPLSGRTLRRTFVMQAVDHAWVHIAPARVGELNAFLMKWACGLSNSCYKVRTWKLVLFTFSDAVTGERTSLREIPGLPAIPERRRCRISIAQQTCSLPIGVVQDYL